MKDITRIGMDTSKSVFQLHGVDGGEQPVLQRKLRRRQVLDFFRKLRSGFRMNRCANKDLQPENPAA